MLVRSPSLTVVPNSWLSFRNAYEEAVHDMEAASISAQMHRDELKNVISTCRQQLHETDSDFSLPKGTPEMLKNSIIKWINHIEGQQGKLLDFLDHLTEDIENAEENENRFIVLVFGEVNCGKSAISNHVAGMDFDVARLKNGQCFCENINVERLSENPTECTRAYQGFRLPGLLWIDCPGVLSRTFANAQLARRLVSRADYMLFVSSSDAPLKQSELKELKSMIEESGNQDLEASLIIAKADIFDEEEDKLNDNIVRRVKRKSEAALDAQLKWCNEQLKNSGIQDMIKMGKPIILSSYVARDIMGRDWVSGSRRTWPQHGWQARYEDSGYPLLFSILEKLVRSRGKKLKASWPLKRRTALVNEFTRAILQSVDGLWDIRRHVSYREKELFAKLAQAQEFASEKAAASVQSQLIKHRVDDIDRFNKEAAMTSLAESLKNSVLEALEYFTKDLIDNYDEDMKNILVNYSKNIDMKFEIKEVFTYKTYESTKKSEGVGRAGGGLLGMAGGAAFGSIFGPVGTLIGGVAGGIIGTLGGNEAGKRIFIEKVRVRVPNGTNADVVINKTQSKMRREAKIACWQCFDELDKMLFKPIIRQTKAIEKKIRSWDELLRTPKR